MTSSANQPENAQQATKIWRRRGLFVAGAVLFVGLAGYVYIHQTSGEAVRTAAKKLLAQYLKGVVDIGAASVHWDGRIEVNHVKIWAPTTAAKCDEQPAFSCERLELFGKLSSFLFGSPQIQSIVAYAPKCRIVHDKASQLTNLSAMFRPTEQGREITLKTLPTVELRNATLIVADRDKNAERVIEEMHLAVRARPATNDASLYDITWRRMDSTGVTEGHTQFDWRLGTFRNISGGLPWVSLEAVLIGVNANYDGASAWSNLLGLSGKVRAVDFDFGSPGDPVENRSATLQLDGASLSIPVSADEYLLPRDDRYLQFKNVSGTIELRTNDILATFSGDFHEAPCHARVILRGGNSPIRSLDDVDVDFELQASNLQLPERGPEAPETERRFIHRWKRVDRFYDLYKPRGRVDIELSAEKKAGAQSRIALKQLSLNARSATAQCQFFPYELAGLTGQVVIKPDGIQLIDLAGSHGRAHVVVNGHLSSPTRCASVALAIQGTNVPIDHDLRVALKPQWRTVVDQLNASGIVDIDLALHRPACTNDELAAWQSDIDVSLQSVKTRYVRFPLDIEQLHGTVHIQGRRFDIIDVQGKSNGADVTLAGKATLDDKGVSTLSLKTKADGLNVDKTLLAALPLSWRQALEPWKPAGRVNVSGSLTFSAQDHQTIYDILVGLDGNQVTPPDIPVRLSNLNGSVLLQPGLVELKNVSAKYQSASIVVEGLVAGASASPQDHLNVTCSGLVLDDEFLERAPIALHSILNEWRTKDPIGLRATIPTVSIGHTGTEMPQVELTLTDATVSHAKFARPFEHVDGTIMLDGQTLTGRNIQARYGGAAIHLDFTQALEKSRHEGNFTIAAKNLHLDRELRASLPQGIRSAWDDIELNGTCDLNIASLKTWQAENNRSLWSIDGDVLLKNTSMFGLAQMQDVNGKIWFSGMLLDRLGGSTVGGKLNLTNLTLHGHKISPLRSTWRFIESAAGQGQLMIDDIDGAAYGGAIAGQLDVRFDKQQTDYSLWTTGHHLDITPLFTGSEATDKTSNPHEQKGLADGRLYLSGTMGNVDSIRGGGRIQIVDSHIYRLPLLLAILPVLNLSMPKENAFDRVDGEFLILSHQLQFNRILLRGDALALLGTGTLTMPDRGLDLHLVHISSSTWTRLPALTDLLEGASRELLEIHVTGPLSQPTVRTMPLQRLTDELKRLFKRSEDKPVASSPGG